MTTLGVRPDFMQLRTFTVASGRPSARDLKLDLPNDKGAPKKTPTEDTRAHAYGRAMATDSLHRARFNLEELL